MSTESFRPLHFALTLPKGFAKEYADRDWFNQIYFSKLSMYHELEGYIPILYNFTFDHQGQYSQVLPDSMLMTFYYPPTKRLSNLNGLVIIGGEPDIDEAHHTTRLLTPYLESLLLDRYKVPNHQIATRIEQSLSLLSDPQRLKSVEDIVSRSYSKDDEDLYTFYPILNDQTYQKEQLALPHDFNLDAVFMIKVDDSFFVSQELGSGILSLRLFHRIGNQKRVEPKLAFPLVFKWQPLYNDILDQMSKIGRILPQHYQGRLIPSTVIFQHKNADHKYTAVMNSVSKTENEYYLHVAVASSGDPNGQPLSLLSAALNREKFGTPAWTNRLSVDNTAKMEKIKEQAFSTDILSTQLREVVPETEITDNGVFDLGKLNSLDIIQ